MFVQSQRRKYNQHKTTMKTYVAYYRVSTAQQSKSGLGLEAQRETVTRFAQGYPIVNEFTEKESGKNDNRVKLQEAIAYAKANNATLLIAKLDRLSRNVKFIFELRDAGVDFVCCDLPDCNTLTLGIFASFAQHERERISQRTKDGLAVAKKRGVVLGKPENLTAKARANGLVVRKANAANNQANRQAAEIVQSSLKAGNSLREIAAKLNGLGFRTRRGNLFSAMQVKRLSELPAKNN